MLLFDVQKVTSIGLSFLLVLFLAVAAIAGIREEVALDFAPSSGYVLKIINPKEYLTDIDGSKGAMAGDLLTIVQAGEPVVHPLTGAQLGSLDQVLAVLRITKVQSGFSYASPMLGAEKIVPGAEVKRFSGLTAVFIDRLGTGKELHASLRSALTNLDWQGYVFQTPEGLSDGFPQTDLTFVLNKGILQIRDSEKRVIRSYPVALADLENAVDSGSASPATAQMQEGSAVLVPDLKTATPNNSPVTWEKSSAPQDSGVRYDFDFPGYQMQGTLSSKVLMADFARDDSGLLLATTDGSLIRVFRLEDELTLVSEYRSPGLEAVHSLNWWRPAEANKKPYLAVTGTQTRGAHASPTQELELSSSLLSLQGNQLIPVAHKLEYLLGSFDRDGDGQRESLLGQSVDLNNFFGSIKSLALKHGKIESSRLNEIYPPRFPVQGSAMADLTGDGILESAFVQKGMLQIFRNGKLIYRLGEGVGGSLSQLTYDKNPGQIDALFSTVSFEVSPLPADIDGDGQLELLVVASEHPSIFSLGSAPQIKKSRLMVIKYQNGRFQKGSLAGELDMPIQGIHADKDQVVIVAYDSETSATGEECSRLLTIPLKGSQQQ